MGKSYRKGEGEDLALLMEVIHQHHAELEREKVRPALILIDPELAEDGQPKAPVFKSDGDSAVGRVRPASAIERLLGKYDLRIEIDGYVWETLSEEQQRALLDHELTHLEIKRDAEGTIKRNADGTPRFMRRAHDWHLTGFREVVARHGRHALEAMDLRELHSNHGQLLFGFLEEAPPVEKPEKKRKTA